MDSNSDDDKNAFDVEREMEEEDSIASEADIGDMLEDNAEREMEEDDSIASEIDIGDVLEDTESSDDDSASEDSSMDSGEGNFSGA